MASGLDGKTGGFDDQDAMSRNGAAARFGAWSDHSDRSDRGGGGGADRLAHGPPALDRQEQARERRENLQMDEQARRVDEQVLRGICRDC